MGANRTSTKISDHLGCIYDLLNNLQTQINNEVNARKSDVNDARAKANAAHAAANAAQATANSKIDKNHTHTFAYGTIKVVGHKGGDADTTVVDIINTSTAGSHRVITSTAQ